MTIAEPLASADDKLLESEIGRNIPKFGALALPFGKPRTAIGNRRPRISAICCVGYQKPRWAKLTISSVSFKRSGENYRPMANAFSATLWNTLN
jgi:hypothetical protein